VAARGAGAAAGRAVSVPLPALWGPLDLFGCDRERPLAPYDGMGLLWLHHDRELIELHRDRAVLKSRTGALQTFYRRPVEVGRVVLAWELRRERPEARRHLAYANPDC
jgi:hypothetical protein